jgi:tetratricopeptide (TPR) repeat protein
VLAEDHLNRLASQHVLAIAYQANGQVKEAVKLLERVVAIQAEVLAEDHPSRLASQHELARAYQANGQVKEAVKLLEHVVAIQAKVLAEDHPDRLLSERLLAAFHEGQLYGSETRQASTSSSKDRCPFNQAPNVPQPISGNSVSFTAMPDESPADQAPKSSSISKRTFLARRLKGILNGGK